MVKDIELKSVEYTSYQKYLLNGKYTITNGIVVYDTDNGDILYSSKYASIAKTYIGKSEPFLYSSKERFKSFRTTFDVLIFPVKYSKVGEYKVFNGLKIETYEKYEIGTDIYNLITSKFTNIYKEKTVLLSSVDNVELIERINQDNSDILLNIQKMTLQGKHLFKYLPNEMYKVEKLEYSKVPVITLKNLKSLSEFQIGLDHILNNYSLVNTDYENMIGSINLGKTFEVLNYKYYKNFNFTKNKIYKIDVIDQKSKVFITNDLNEKVEISFGELFQHFKLI